MLSRNHRLFIAVMALMLVLTACQKADSGPASSSEAPKTEATVSAAASDDARPRTDGTAQVKEVFAGFDSTFVLLDNDELWVWSEHFPHPKVVAEGMVDTVLPRLLLTNAAKVISNPGAQGNAPLFLQQDGTLWQWQPGDVDEQEAGRLAKVMEGVRDAAAAYGRTVAIKEDDSLWLWGLEMVRNSEGKFAETNEPTHIMDAVAEVELGQGNILALKQDGTLWSWGVNDKGLGIGQVKEIFRPHQIMSEVERIALSDDCGFAWDREGRLWGWGNLQSHGLLDLLPERTGEIDASVPTLLAEDIIDIKAQPTHGRPDYPTFIDFYLKEDGTLWGRGYNYNGLQLDDSLQDTDTFKLMMDSVQSFALGLEHIVVLTTAGEAYTWGGNTYGQLANGDIQIRQQPGQVLDEVEQIALSRWTPQLGMINEDHSLAIRSDASLWAWGSNILGQLGDGSTTRSLVPKKVLDGVVKAAAGRWCSYAIDEAGVLWGWGQNDNGILGADLQPRLSPQRIDEGVRDIAADNRQLLVLKEDGHLWRYGYGFDVSGYAEPGLCEASLILDQVEAMALSSSHALALRQDGSLWGWGSNMYGQLGDQLEYELADLMKFHAEPIFIMDGVVTIAAGGPSGGGGPLGRSFVIKEDGTLWGFGSNYQGAVWPYSTEFHIREPLQLMEDVVGVEAGIFVTYAWNSQGELFCWGEGAAPHLFATEVADIAVGANHALMLKPDGTLWSWGRNDSGELGIGTSRAQATPLKLDLAQLTPELAATSQSQP